MSQHTSGRFALIDLQQTLVTAVSDALSPMRFFKPSGDETRINIYSQQLPLSAYSDEDDELSAAPYGIIRMTNGGKDDDEPFKVNFYILFCVYDNSPKKTGHELILNIIGRLEAYFGSKSSLGNFDIEPGFDFALQDSDTHPFYYGAIQVSFGAPKTKKESPFA